MLVREVMKRDVLTAGKGMGIQEAAEVMNDNQAGCLVVVEGETVVGILTERDVLRMVSETEDLKGIEVGDVMTNYVYTVSPDQNLEAAARLLKAHKIKKLPVMEGRKLVGIITATDIVVSYPEMVMELKSVLLKKARD